MKRLGSNLLLFVFWLTNCVLQTVARDRPYSDTVWLNYSFSACYLTESLEISEEIHLWPGISGDECVIFFATW